MKIEDAVLLIRERLIIVDPKRVDLEESFYWGAKTKSSYNKAQKEISKIRTQGKNWKLMGWCDVSGFDYWMKKEKEQNYIQITIMFKKMNITKADIKEVSLALDDAICIADKIAHKYSFNPYISDER
jgi:hypothetical protein